MTVYATATDLSTPPMGKIPTDVDATVRLGYATDASEMIEARLARTWTLGTQPSRVTMATVILAVRLYEAALDNYLPRGGDAALGQLPAPPILWDRVIDDLLFGLAPDGSTSAGGVSGIPRGGDLTRTAPVVSPVGWPDANDAIYRGDPNAPYGARRI